MTQNEKIFLIQVLLLDVRGNWSDPIEPRVSKAKELCEEIGGFDFLTLASECEWFLKYFDGWIDGRHFREDFPYGYKGMNRLHGLPRTFNDKSDEFKACVKELVTYPYLRFKDIKEDEI